MTWLPINCIANLANVWFFGLRSRNCFILQLLVTRESRSSFFLHNLRNRYHCIFISSLRHDSALDLIVRVVGISIIVITMLLLWMDSCEQPVFIDSAEMVDFWLDTFSDAQSKSITKNIILHQKIRNYALPRNRFRRCTMAHVLIGMLNTNNR